METLVRGSDFRFHCINFLHYKCHKINLKHSGSYIGSYDWIKSKKIIINSIIDDDKHFQCTATVTLNHEEIEQNSKRT